MFGIAVSALNTMLAWIFRVIVFKSMVFGVLYYITSEFFAYLVGKMAGAALGGLQSSVDGLPGSVLWLLQVFRVDVGLPMVLAAAGLAFTIRRIPVIG